MLILLLHSSDNSVFFAIKVNGLGEMGKEILNGGHMVAQQQK